MNCTLLHILEQIRSKYAGKEGNIGNILFSSFIFLDLILEPFHIRQPFLNGNYERTGVRGQLPRK